MEDAMIGTQQPVADQGRFWSRLRKDSPFFLVAVAVFALDQLTKYLVRANMRLGQSFPESGPVRIVRVTNTGAAFGMLQGQTFFLTVTTLLGLGAILLYYLYPPMDNRILRIALGLQLGGAVGNLSDRVRVGEVTDFIQWPHWPAFNVADSSITVGVVAIVVFLTLSDTIWRKRET
ncbi:MAG: signal peptidase II [Dehalococcoidia bacterium]|jgi:signal peptidase II